MTRELRPFAPVGGLRQDELFGVVWAKDVEGLAQTHKDLRGRFCGKPFTWMEVGGGGRVWLCCPSWLPQAVGNVLHQSMAEIWNGPAAQAVRATISDGSFSLCNHGLCPHIADGSLPDAATAHGAGTWPTHINFAFDESCNLECPSCRVSKIIHAHGPEYDARRLILSRVIGEIFAAPHDHPVELYITGSGDAFGSKIFREFLQTFDPAPWPKLTLCLATNGVMMTPKIFDSIKLWHGRIRDIRVSFDAASAATYAQTRKGGHWETLLANMDHLNALVPSLPRRPDVHADFVVQDLNFTEMPAYAEMIVNRFPNFVAAAFGLVTDWATWSPEVYRQRAIWKQDHPRYGEFQAALADPRLQHPKVHLRNVLSAI